MEHTLEIKTHSKNRILDFVWPKEHLRPMLIMLVAYILVAQLSRLLFYFAPGAPAVILTPAGVALAGVILYGYKFWPAIALGSILNGIVGSSHPFLVIIGAFSSTVQALLGGYVLNKFKFSPALNRLRYMMLLMGVAFFITPVAPLLNTLGRWLIGVPGPTSWYLSWLASITSVMVITTFLVRWITYPQLKRIRFQLTETIIITALLIGINFLIFWTPYNTFRGVSLALVQLALFGWIALRMGTARMTLAFLATTIIGLMGPYLGFVEIPDSDFAQKIIGIQFYIIIFAALFYAITTISEERDEVTSTLKGNVQNLEEALQRISFEDQKKNDFIATLAHELRNPLSPMVSYLELMRAQGVENSQFKDSVYGISQQIKNMSRLLEDLLDVSRITRDKIELRKEGLDTRLVLERAVESVRGLIKEKSHKLGMTLPPQPVIIYADPIRLEQVVINLLNNAIKYTNPGGTIWLTCFSDKENAVITIRDNGIGIPPHMLSSIFEMFNQVDQSITRSYGGLGIGLKLVKSFVEMHSGTVVAVSEGLGKGSEFTIRIPKYNK